MEAMTPLAERSQRLQALERANQIRVARSALKRRIAAGTVTASAAILSGRSELERMAVGELLLCQPRWGRARCQGFLMSVPMSETKTVGSMTDRQRAQVAAMLSAQDRTRCTA